MADTLWIASFKSNRKKKKKEKVDNTWLPRGIRGGWIGRVLMNGGQQHRLLGSIPFQGIFAAGSPFQKDTDLS